MFYFTAIIILFQPLTQFPTHAISVPQWYPHNTGLFTTRAPLTTPSRYGTLIHWMWFLLEDHLHTLRGCV